MKKLTKNNSSAFTLVEVITSISILVFMTAYVLNIVGGLVEQGNKGKIYVDLGSEVSSLLSVVSNYIYHADDLEVLSSKIKIKGSSTLDGLLIKNSGDKLNTSLFTIVKPFSRELINRELPLYPGENNHFVGITDINLFADLEFYKKSASESALIYSDPGSSSINFILQDGTEGVLIGGKGEDNPLNTPTGLHLTTNNFLLISDTYNHVIYYVPLNDIDFNSSNVIDNNKKLVNYIGRTGKAGFSDGITGQNSLNRPMGLTMTGNILYIVDSGNHAVRMFDVYDKKELITYIGSGKPGISKDDTFHKAFELNSPTDIDYSSENGLLYLSDTNNNRIISFGPASTREGKKPYTVAGIGKRSTALTGPGIFGAEKEINFDGDQNSGELLADEDLIGVSGFSGDFSLSTSAQFNHPTGIEVYNKGELLVSDSGNNLIRRLYVYPHEGLGPSEDCNDPADGVKKCLKNNINLIDTIVGNATEIALETGDQSAPPVKSSLKAPRGVNFQGISKSKLARINNPLGIKVIGDDFYFLSMGSFGSMGANGDVKKYSMSGGSAINAELSTLVSDAFKYINIDNISFSKVGDFLSSNSVLELKFDIVSNEDYPEDINENKPQSLVKIVMSVVGYLRDDQPIISDIATSISPRKIIPLHP